MSHHISTPIPVKDLIPVKRALLSLSNKEGLKELCEFLSKMGCELVATSSTYKAIKGYGFLCTTVDSITQFPEILGGRVKTLHPKVFGGILARGSLESDTKDMKDYNIQAFDIVVCNLYPFQNALANGASPSELVEFIDIGGVSLLRAAAKNHASVSVLCDVFDYGYFKEVISKNVGNTTLSLRKQLAVKAFRETAAYDEFISSTLEKYLEIENNLLHKTGPVRTENINSIDLIPDSLSLSLIKEFPLRYGENPHQNAAFYRMADLNNNHVCSIANMKCFHGKELSYNNVLDIEHAIRLSNEFKEDYAAIIIKHNTPCGVGISKNSIVEAYIRAFEADPVSPFGGIVCVTTEVTTSLAQRLSETFLEVVIAPKFESQALEVLQKKKNLRLVTYDAHLPLANKTIFTHVQGGFLAQSSNNTVIDLNKITYPTLIKPDSEVLKALTLGMAIVKHVRSNAIVLANKEQALSIAGGFTNRVDAVEQCLKKVRLSLTNAVLASDAFFPFPDSIELIKNSGIKHIIQPGGSIQDVEVVKACDKYGISMVFSGNRHFKH